MKLNCEKYNEWAVRKGFVKKAGPAALLTEFNRFISGTWHFGGNYRQISDFPGSYPIQYVDRIKVLIPGLSAGFAGNLMHLFAGSLAIPHYNLQDRLAFRGTTLDLCSVSKFSPVMEPDIVANAENFTDSLSWNLWKQSSGISAFQFIAADTIYNDRQAREKYDLPVAPSRDAVVAESWKVLVPGGLLIWIDEMEPAHNNRLWRHAADITIRLGQKKFARVLTILEKI